MNYSIKHLFHISAEQEEVFRAISTIEGLSNWWTVQSSGSDELDGEIQFDFGDYIGPTMKVITKEASSRVQWECIKSEHGWNGHIFTFDVDRNEGKTRVRFEHSGWNVQDDFHALCTFSWGRYLESLRQYCQTGTGEAFGSPGYRT